MEPVVSTCSCPLIGQSPNQFLFPTLNSTSNMTELPMHPCLSMIVDLDQPHGWSLLGWTAVLENIPVGAL